MKKYTIYMYTISTTPISDKPILDKSPSSKIEKADSLEEAQKIAKDNKNRFTRIRIFPTGENEKTIEEYMNGEKVYPR
ncbi:MAG: hypothetical protein KAT52_07080 [Desulfobacterales bacterium]|nr:hypothetical protein [Desulfobacterales bacterium]